MGTFFRGSTLFLACQASRSFSLFLIFLFPLGVTTFDLLFFHSAANMRYLRVSMPPAVRPSVIERCVLRVVVSIVSCVTSVERQKHLWKRFFNQYSSSSVTIQILPLLSSYFNHYPVSSITIHLLQSLFNCLNHCSVSSITIQLFPGQHLLHDTEGLSPLRPLCLSLRRLLGLPCPLCHQPVHRRRPGQRRRQRHLLVLRCSGQDRPFQLLL